MRDDSNRGARRTIPAVPSARDRGWDDSLYKGRATKPRGGPAEHDGERAGGGAPASGEDSGADDDGGADDDRAGDGTDGTRGGGGAGDATAPRKKKRFLRWFALAVSLLILLTAGAGYVYYQYLNGNLSKDILNLGDNRLDRSKPNADGQRPLNILLLGSDSRASEANIELGGSRGDKDRPPLADVQMLLHVSADRSNMSVLSVPRDTRATIPKCTDPDDGTVYPQATAKINTSLQRGGPGCTVATWEEMTGIPVDHFMMIDFTGVVSMADAVGGVPVCVDKNVHDPRSGLRLAKGETVIKGEQALQWLRTRHGFEDGSDIGRARAQHMYMNAMVRQLKSGTKLTDPGKLQNLAEAATKALTVDKGIGSVKKLYDLGNDLKQVPTGRITMATMPWTYAPGGFVVPKEGDAERTFSLIRNDIALDGKDKKRPGASKSPQPTEPSVPKAQLPVQVQNGTGTALQAPVTGRAAQVAGLLNGKGFARAAAEPTPKSQADTTVSYADAKQRGDALAVAEALGLPESAVKHSSGVTGVTLVIGTDWRAGTVYPEQPRGGADDNGGDGDGADGTADNKAPDSADALRGDDENACMEVNPRYTW